MTSFFYKNLVFYIGGKKSNQLTHYIKNFNFEQTTKLATLLTYFIIANNLDTLQVFLTFSKLTAYWYLEVFDNFFYYKLNQHTTISDGGWIYNSIYFVPITNFRNLYFDNFFNFIENCTFGGGSTFFFYSFGNIFYSLGFFNDFRGFIFLSLVFLLSISIFFNFFKTFWVFGFLLLMVAYLFQLYFFGFFYTTDALSGFRHFEFTVDSTFRSRNTYIDSNYFLTSNVLLGLERFSDVSTPWLVDYSDSGWGLDFDSQSQVDQIVERERSYIQNEMNLNFSPNRDSLLTEPGSLRGRTLKLRQRVSYFFEIFSKFFFRFVDVSDIFKTTPKFSTESEFQSWSDISLQFFGNNHPNLNLNFNANRRDGSSHFVGFGGFTDQRQTISSYLPRVEISNDFLLPKKNNIGNSNFSKIGNISDRKQSVFRKLTKGGYFSEVSKSIKHRIPDFSKESNYVFERQLQSERSFEFDFKEFLKKRLAIRSLHYYFENQTEYRVSPSSLLEGLVWPKKRIAKLVESSVGAGDAVSANGRKFSSTRLSNQDLGTETLLKFWSQSSNMHNFIGTRDLEFVYFKNTNRFVRGFFYNGGSVNSLLYDLLTSYCLGVGMFTYQDFGGNSLQQTTPTPISLVPKINLTKVPVSIKLRWLLTDSSVFSKKLMEFVNFNYQGLQPGDKKYLYSSLLAVLTKSWFDFEGSNLTPSVADMVKLSIYEFTVRPQQSSTDNVLSDYGVGWQRHNNHQNLTLNNYNNLGSNLPNVASSAGSLKFREKLANAVRYSDELLEFFLIFSEKNPTGTHKNLFLSSLTGKFKHYFDFRESPKSSGWLFYQYYNFVIFKLPEPRSTGESSRYIIKKYDSQTQFILHYWVVFGEVYKRALKFLFIFLDYFSIVFKNITYSSIIFSPIKVFSNFCFKVYSDFDKYQRAGMVDSLVLNWLLLSYGYAYRIFFIFFLHTAHFFDSCQSLIFYFKKQICVQNALHTYGLVELFVKVKNTTNMLTGTQLFYRIGKNHVEGFCSGNFITELRAYARLVTKPSALQNKVNVISFGQFDYLVAKLIFFFTSLKSYFFEVTLGAYCSAFRFKGFGVVGLLFAKVSFWIFDILYFFTTDDLCVNAKSFIIFFFKWSAEGVNHFFFIFDLNFIFFNSFFEFIFNTLFDFYFGFLVNKLSLFLIFLGKISTAVDYRFLFFLFDGADFFKNKEIIARVEKKHKFEPAVGTSGYFRFLFFNKVLVTNASFFSNYFFNGCESNLQFFFNIFYLYENINFLLGNTAGTHGTCKLSYFISQLGDCCFTGIKNISCVFDYFSVNPANKSNYLKVFDFNKNRGNGRLKFFDGNARNDCSVDTVILGEKFYLDLPILFFDNFVKISKVCGSENYGFKYFGPILDSNSINNQTQTKQSPAIGFNFSDPLDSVNDAYCQLPAYLEKTNSTLMSFSTLKGFFFNTSPESEAFSVIGKKMFETLSFSYWFFNSNYFFTSTPNLQFYSFIENFSISHVAPSGFFFWQKHQPVLGGQLNTNVEFYTKARKLIRADLFGFGSIFKSADFSVKRNLGSNGFRVFDNFQQSGLYQSTPRDDFEFYQNTHIFSKRVAGKRLRRLRKLSSNVRRAFYIKRNSRFFKDFDNMYTPHNYGSSDYFSDLGNFYYNRYSSGNLLYSTPGISFSYNFGEVGRVVVVSDSPSFIKNLTNIQSTVLLYYSFFFKLIYNLLSMYGKFYVIESDVSLINLYFQLLYIYNKLAKVTDSCVFNFSIGDNVGIGFGTVFFDFFFFRALVSSLVWIISFKIPIQFIFDHICNSNSAFSLYLLERQFIFTGLGIFNTTFSFESSPFIFDLIRFFKFFWQVYFEFFYYMDFSYFFFYIEYFIFNINLFIFKTICLNFNSFLCTNNSIFFYFDGGRVVRLVFGFDWVVGYSFFTKLNTVFNFFLYKNVDIRQLNNFGLEVYSLFLSLQKIVSLQFDLFYSNVNLVCLLASKFDLLFYFLNLRSDSILAWLQFEFSQSGSIVNVLDFSFFFDTMAELGDFIFLYFVFNSQTLFEFYGQLLWLDLCIFFDFIFERLSEFDIMTDVNPASDSIYIFLEFFRSVLSGNTSDKLPLFFFNFFDRDSWEDSDDEDYFYSSNEDDDFGDDSSFGLSGIDDMESLDFLGWGSNINLGTDPGNEFSTINDMLEFPAEVEKFLLTDISDFYSNLFGLDAPKVGSLAPSFDITLPINSLWLVNAIYYNPNLGGFLSIDFGALLDFVQVLYLDRRVSFFSKVYNLVDFSVLNYRDSGFLFFKIKVNYFFIDVLQILDSIFVNPLDFVEYLFFYFVFITSYFGIGFSISVYIFVIYFSKVNKLFENSSRKFNANTYFSFTILSQSFNYFVYRYVYFFFSNSILFLRMSIIVTLFLSVLFIFSEGLHVFSILRLFSNDQDSLLMVNGLFFNLERDPFVERFSPITDVRDQFKYESGIDDDWERTHYFRPTTEVLGGELENPAVVDFIGFSKKHSFIHYLDEQDSEFSGSVSNLTRSIPQQIHNRVPDEQSFSPRFSGDSVLEREFFRESELYGPEIEGSLDWENRSQLVINSLEDNWRFTSWFSEQHVLESDNFAQWNWGFSRDNEDYYNDLYDALLLNIADPRWLHDSSNILSLYDQKPLQFNHSKSQLFNFNSTAQVDSRSVESSAALRIFNTLARNSGNIDFSPVLDNFDINPLSDLGISNFDILGSSIGSLSNSSAVTDDARLDVLNQYSKHSMDQAIKMPMYFNYVDTSSNDDIDYGSSDRFLLETYFDTIFNTKPIESSTKNYATVTEKFRNRFNRRRVKNFNNFDNFHSKMGKRWLLENNFKVRKFVTDGIPEGYFNATSYVFRDLSNHQVKLVDTKNPQNISLENLRRRDTKFKKISGASPATIFYDTLNSYDVDKFLYYNFDSIFGSHSNYSKYFNNNEYLLKFDLNEPNQYWTARKFPRTKWQWNRKWGYDSPYQDYFEEDRFDDNSVILSLMKKKKFDEESFDLFTEQPQFSDVSVRKKKLSNFGKKAFPVSSFDFFFFDKLRKSKSPAVSQQISVDRGRTVQKKQNKNYLAENKFSLWVSEGPAGLQNFGKKNTNSLGDVIYGSRLGYFRLFAELSEKYTNFNKRSLSYYTESLKPIQKLTADVTKESAIFGGSRLSSIFGGGSVFAFKNFFFEANNFGFFKRYLKFDVKSKVGGNPGIASKSTKAFDFDDGSIQQNVVNSIARLFFRKKDTILHKPFFGGAAAEEKKLINNFPNRDSKVWSQEDYVNSTFRKKLQEYIVSEVDNEITETDLGVNTYGDFKNSIEESLFLNNAWYFNNERKPVYGLVATKFSPTMSKSLSKYRESSTIRASDRASVLSSIWKSRKSREFRDVVGSSSLGSQWPLSYRMHALILPKYSENPIFLNDEEANKEYVEMYNPNFYRRSNDLDTLSDGSLRELEYFREFNLNSIEQGRYYPEMQWNPGGRLKSSSSGAARLPLKDRFRPDPSYNYYGTSDTDQSIFRVIRNSGYFRQFRLKGGDSLSSLRGFSFYDRLFDELDGDRFNNKVDWYDSLFFTKVNKNPWGFDSNTNIRWFGSQNWSLQKHTKNLSKLFSLPSYRVFGGGEVSISKKKKKFLNLNALNNSDRLGGISSSALSAYGWLDYGAKNNWLFDVAREPINDSEKFDALQNSANANLDPIWSSNGEFGQNLDSLKHTTTLHKNRTNNLYDILVYPQHQRSSVDRSFNSELKHEWRTKFYQYGKLFRSLEQVSVLSDYFSRNISQSNRALTPRQLNDYFWALYRPLKKNKYSDFLKSINLSDRGDSVSNRLVSNNWDIRIKNPSNLHNGSVFGDSPTFKDKMLSMQTIGENWSSDFIRKKVIGSPTTGFSLSEFNTYAIRWSKFFDRNNRGGLRNKLKGLRGKFDTLQNRPEYIRHHGYSKLRREHWNKIISMLTRGSFTKVNDKNWWFLLPRLSKNKTVHGGRTLFVLDRIFGNYRMNKKYKNPLFDSNNSAHRLFAIEELKRKNIKKTTHDIRLRKFKTQFSVSTNTMDAIRMLYEVPTDQKLNTKDEIRLDTGNLEQQAVKSASRDYPIVSESSDMSTIRNSNISDKKKTAATFLLDSGVDLLSDFSSLDLNYSGSYPQDSQTFEQHFLNNKKYASMSYNSFLGGFSENGLGDSLFFSDSSHTLKKKKLVNYDTAHFLPNQSNSTNWLFRDKHDRHYSETKTVIGDTSNYHTSSTSFGGHGGSANGSVGTTNDGYISPNTDLSEPLPSSSADRSDDNLDISSWQRSFSVSGLDYEVGPDFSDADEELIDVAEPDDEEDESMMYNTIRLGGDLLSVLDMDSDDDDLDDDESLRENQDFSGEGLSLANNSLSERLSGMESSEGSPDTLAYGAELNDGDTRDDENDTVVIDFDDGPDSEYRDFLTFENTLDYNLTMPENQNVIYNFYIDRSLLGNGDSLGFRKRVEPSSYFFNKKLPKTFGFGNLPSYLDSQTATSQSNAGRLDNSVRLTTQDYLNAADNTYVAEFGRSDKQRNYPVSLVKVTNNASKSLRRYSELLSQDSRRGDHNFDLNAGLDLSSVSSMFVDKVGSSQLTGVYDILPENLSTKSLLLLEGSYGGLAQTISPNHGTVFLNRYSAVVPALGHTRYRERIDSHTDHFSTELKKAEKTEEGDDEEEDPLFRFGSPNITTSSAKIRLSRENSEHYFKFRDNLSYVPKSISNFFFNSDPELALSDRNYVDDVGISVVKNLDHNFSYNSASDLVSGGSLSKNNDNLLGYEKSKIAANVGSIFKNAKLRVLPEGRRINAGSFRVFSANESIKPLPVQRSLSLDSKLFNKINSLRIFGSGKLNDFLYRPKLKHLLKNQINFYDFDKSGILDDFGPKDDKFLNKFDEFDFPFNSNLNRYKSLQKSLSTKVLFADEVEDSFTGDSGYFKTDTDFSINTNKEPSNTFSKSEHNFKFPSNIIDFEEFEGTDDPFFFEDNEDPDNLILESSETITSGGFDLQTAVDFTKFSNNLDFDVSSHNNFFSEIGDRLDDKRPGQRLQSLDILYDSDFIFEKKYKKKKEGSAFIDKRDWLFSLYKKVTGSSTSQAGSGWVLSDRASDDFSFSESFDKNEEIFSEIEDESEVNNHLGIFEADLADDLSIFSGDSSHHSTRSAALGLFDAEHLQDLESTREILLFNHKKPNDFDEPFGGYDSNLEELQTFLEDRFNGLMVPSEKTHNSVWFDEGRFGHSAKNLNFENLNLRKESIGENTNLFKLQRQPVYLGNDYSYTLGGKSLKKSLLFDRFNRFEINDYFDWWSGNEQVFDDFEGVHARSLPIHPEVDVVDNQVLGKLIALDRQQSDIVRQDLAKYFIGEQSNSNLGAFSDFYSQNSLDFIPSGHTEDGKESFLFKTAAYPKSWSIYNNVNEVGVWGVGDGLGKVDQFSIFERKNALNILNTLYLNSSSYTLSKNSLNISAKLDKDSIDNLSTLVRKSESVDNSLSSSTSGDDDEVVDDYFEGLDISERYIHNIKKTIGTGVSPTDLVYKKKTFGRPLHSTLSAFLLKNKKDPDFFYQYEGSGLLSTSYVTDTENDELEVELNYYGNYLEPQNSELFGGYSSIDNHLSERSGIVTNYQKSSDKYQTLWNLSPSTSVVEPQASLDLDDDELPFDSSSYLTFKFEDMLTTHVDDSVLNKAFLRIDSEEDSEYPHPEAFMGYSRVRNQFPKLQTGKFSNSYLPLSVVSTYLANIPNLNPNRIVSESPKFVNFFFNKKKSASSLFEQDFASVSFFDNDFSESRLNTHSFFKKNTAIDQFAIYHKSLRRPGFEIGDFISNVPIAPFRPLSSMSVLRDRSDKYGISEHIFKNSPVSRRSFDLAVRKFGPSIRTNATMSGYGQLEEVTDFNHNSEEDSGLHNNLGYPVLNEQNIYVYDFPQILPKFGSKGSLFTRGFLGFVWRGGFRSDQEQEDDRSRATFGFPLLGHLTSTSDVSNRQWERSRTFGKQSILSYWDKFFFLFTKRQGYSNTYNFEPNFTKYVQIWNSTIPRKFKNRNNSFNGKMNKFYEDKLYNRMFSQNYNQNELEDQENFSYAHSNHQDYPSDILSSFELSTNSIWDSFSSKKINGPFFEKKVTVPFAKDTEEKNVGPLGFEEGDSLYDNRLLNRGWFPEKIALSLGGRSQASVGSDQSTLELLSDYAHTFNHDVDNFGPFARVEGLKSLSWAGRGNTLFNAVDDIVEGFGLEENVPFKPSTARGLWEWEDYVERPTYEDFDLSDFKFNEDDEEEYFGNWQDPMEYHQFKDDNFTTLPMINYAAETDSWLDSTYLGNLDSAYIPGVSLAISDRSVYDGIVSDFLSFSSDKFPINPTEGSAGVQLPPLTDGLFGKSDFLDSSIPQFSNYITTSLHSEKQNTSSALENQKRNLESHFEMLETFKSKDVFNFSPLPQGSLQFDPEWVVNGEGWLGGSGSQIPSISLTNIPNAYVNPVSTVTTQPIGTHSFIMTNDLDPMAGEDSPYFSLSDYQNNRIIRGRDNDVSNFPIKSGWNAISPVIPSSLNSQWSHRVGSKSFMDFDEFNQEFTVDTQNWSKFDEIVATVSGEGFRFSDELEDNPDFIVFSSAAVSQRDLWWKSVAGGYMTSESREEVASALATQDSEKYRDFLNSYDYRIFGKSWTNPQESELPVKSQLFYGDSQINDFLLSKESLENIRKSSDLTLIGMKDYTFGLFLTSQKNWDADLNFFSIKIRNFLYIMYNIVVVYLMYFYSSLNGSFFLFVYFFIYEFYFKLDFIFFGIFDFFSNFTFYTYIFNYYFLCLFFYFFKCFISFWYWILYFFIKIDTILTISEDFGLFSLLKSTLDYLRFNFNFENCFFNIVFFLFVYIFLFLLIILC